MSRDEIKTAIYQLLDNTSDQVLNEVLEYLRSVKDPPVEKVNLSQNLRTVLSEDKEPLQRLAK